MSRYEVGKQYYIPASVVSNQKRSEDDRYPITVSFLYSNKKTQFFTFADEPDLLLTAEEVYASRQMADEIGHIEDMLDYGRQKYDEIATLKSENERLSKQNEELGARLAEFKDTIGKQSDKLKELQARIIELNEVNSSLGENRDALNNEAAVHMTSIHNLQVAVEVLAEKIFEMRCEQDG